MEILVKLAYIDIRTNTTYIRNFKAGSNSIIQAIAYSVILAEEPPEDTFKIFFIRYVPDRLASYYSSVVPGHKYNSFSYMVDDILNTPPEQVNAHVRPQSLLCSDADFIGKYENLVEDFAKIKSKFTYTSPLLHINKSPKKQPWQELFKKLTDKQIEGLKAYYSEDLKHYAISNNRTH